jgi:hypothetical protein
MVALSMHATQQPDECLFRVKNSRQSMSAVAAAFPESSRYGRFVPLYLQFAVLARSHAGQAAIGCPHIGFGGAYARRQLIARLGGAVAWPV